MPRGLATPFATRRVIAVGPGTAPFGSGPTSPFFAQFGPKPPGEAFAGECVGGMLHVHHDYKIIYITFVYAKPAGSDRWPFFSVVIQSLTYRRHVARTLRQSGLYDAAFHAEGRVGRRASPDQGNFISTLLRWPTNAIPLPRPS